MAKPTEHAIIFEHFIDAGYMNVYREPEGTAYGLLFDTRDEAQKGVYWEDAFFGGKLTGRPPSYRLHIKPKAGRA